MLFGVARVYNSLAEICHYNVHDSGQGLLETLYILRLLKFPKRRNLTMQYVTQSTALL